jgi:hypothetical protein
VFENGLPREIAGPNREEVTGEEIKLYNERFDNSYSFTNVVMVIESRKMNAVMHVGGKGEMRN